MRFKTILLGIMLLGGIGITSLPAQSNTSSDQWLGCSPCIPNEVCKLVVKEACTCYFGPNLGYSFSFLWAKYLEGSLTIEYQGRGVFKVALGNDWAWLMLEDI